MCGDSETTDREWWSGWVFREQLDLSQDGAITMKDFESGSTVFVDSKNNSRNKPNDPKESKDRKGAKGRQDVLRYMVK